jgi:hypothetical protein
LFFYRFTVASGFFPRSPCRHRPGRPKSKYEAAFREIPAQKSGGYRDGRNA